MIADLLSNVNSFFVTLLMGEVSASVLYFFAKTIYIALDFLYI